MSKAKISALDVDAVLPQTQCRECGYAGCMPYAEALSVDAAPLNLCLPGGLDVIKKLGNLLQKDVSEYLDKVTKQEDLVIAKIREEDCIGCTKCISACPVDAIIGTNKHMHTIIDFECTGCGLCVDPCPMDCIEMIPQPKLTYIPDKARERYNAKKIRELKYRQEQNKKYLEKRKLANENDDIQVDIKAKQEYILKALERVNLKKKTNE